MSRSSATAIYVPSEPLAQKRYHGKTSWGYGQIGLKLDDLPDGDDAARIASARDAVVATLASTRFRRPRIDRTAAEVCALMLRERRTGLGWLWLSKQGQQYCSD